MSATGLDHESTVALTRKGCFFTPVFKVGNPSNGKEDQQDVQVWGLGVNSRTARSDREGGTRAESDCLDALNGPDGLPTVAIEPIPCGPWKGTFGGGFQVPRARGCW